jgi:nickel-dependent lactate racemase
VALDLGIEIKSRYPMNIRVPYGHSFLSASLPDHVKLDIIKPPSVPPSEEPAELVAAALDKLLGDLNFQTYSGVKSAAIAVNDKTRRVPHEELLPPLLGRLEDLGIPDEKITFYIAVGTHSPALPENFPVILPPDITKRYKIRSHDAEDEESLKFLGNTSQGTPVWVNRGFVEADLKIVVGNIEAHQFAGYSGGVKSAAIGLAGLKTINHNHAMMTHVDSQMGEYKTNPVRRDIEEIGLMMGIDLALNAILNQEKEIVHVFAGDPVSVMESGVPFSKQVCQVSVPQPYGLVISSPGGHPKDINVYQAQKALSSAVKITRAGGTVIVAAACPEGSGSEHYEEWVTGKESYADVLQQYQAEGFRIGPHKAYQFARDTTQTRLMFCSDMDQELAQMLLLNPIKDLQTAVDMALEDLGPNDIVGVLPHAASTIPYLK